MEACSGFRETGRVGDFLSARRYFRLLWRLEPNIRCPVWLATNPCLAEACNLRNSPNPSFAGIGATNDRVTVVAIRTTAVIMAMVKNMLS